MNEVTWLEGTATVAQLMTAVGVVVGAWVAVRGLKTWKLQLHGQAEYELARHMLRSLIKVRDAIGVVRNPFIQSGEVEGAYRDAGIEATSQPQKRTEGLVYERRWKHLNDAFVELEVFQVECEALWGPEIRTATLDLRAVTAELYVALQQYLNQKSDQEQDHVQMQDVRDKIFEGGGTLFSSRIANAIERIQNVIRPKLRP